MHAYSPLSSWLALGLMLSAPVRAAEPATAASPLPDVPCKVYQTTDAVYPVRLHHLGVMSGSARIVAEINPEGKLGDILVAAYTHPEFARAALDALRAWRFEPGYLQGRPITSILTVDFEFETTGVLVREVTFDRKAPDPFDETYAYRPHGIASLDRRPVRAQGEEPVYPKAWIEAGRTGSVLVEFFIDESGRTRLPVLAEHNDHFLASSALTAIKTWRFEPPTHRGKPVLVQAAQLFVFEPPEQSVRKGD
jgi:TonB family protein